MCFHFAPELKAPNHCRQAKTRCTHLAQKHKMEKYTKEILQKKSAKYIANLFINHHINCSINEHKILFNKEQISIETYCFGSNSNQDLTILQLDVYINYGVNSILESFAGLGKDFETANIDAFENFQKQFLSHYTFCIFHAEI